MSEIKYLNTQGVTYYLGELLKNANSRIILVSPYIKLQKRVKEILNQQESRVCIDVVCRKDDLKGSPMISANFYDLPDLHAKCYLSEQAAIFTSMNLYEFSQQNNHEMGIYVENRGKGKTLYQEILKEVEGLISVAARFECGKKYAVKQEESKSNETFIKDGGTNPLSTLNVGEEYPWHILKSFFNFKDDFSAGIKETESKDLVLRCSVKGPFPNRWEDDILYFCGQNTDKNKSKDQELWYGNKVLMDAYEGRVNGRNGGRKIYLFVDNEYLGLCEFAKKPCREKEKKTDRWVWVFPLKLKQTAS